MNNFDFSSCNKLAKNNNKEYKSTLMFYTTFIIFKKREKKEAFNFSFNAQCDVSGGFTTRTTEMFFIVKKCCFI